MKFSQRTENQKFWGACIAIFILGTGSAVASTGNAPDTVVTKLNTALIHSMKMGPSISYESRFHALYPEISHAYDFSKIAHYSLGTAWANFSVCLLIRFRSAWIPPFFRAPVNSAFCIARLLTPSVVTLTIFHWPWFWLSR